MLKAKPAVVRAFLALAVLVAAVAVSAPSSATAHAAAATTNCSTITYWSYNDSVGTTTASFSSGTVYYTIHLDVLRDEYTGYYCGQYRVTTCAWVPYNLDPSHSYKLWDQLDLNGSYVTYQVTQWVSPNPGHETTVCLPTTQHGAIRGSVVGVYAEVMAVTANIYGHPYFQFPLY